MSAMYFLAILKIMVDTFTSFKFSETMCKISEKAHQTSLAKVLSAPVNNFFDVTPIGKVLRIFNEDMNVFQAAENFRRYFRMVDFGAHCFVVFAVLIPIAPLEVLIFILTFLWLGR